LNFIITIYIYNRYFTDDNIEVIPPGIGNLVQLKEL